MCSGDRLEREWTDIRTGGVGERHHGDPTGEFVEAEGLPEVAREGKARRRPAVELERPGVGLLSLVPAIEIPGTGGEHSQERNDPRYGAQRPRHHRLLVRSAISVGDPARAGVVRPKSHQRRITEATPTSAQNHQACQKPVRASSTVAVKLTVPAA